MAWVCLNWDLFAQPQIKRDWRQWKARNVLGGHLYGLARGPSGPRALRRVRAQSCMFFPSDPQGFRRKLHSYPRDVVICVEPWCEISLFVVCYYNPSALWEILYGCFSSLTGLFHCAFVIVINTEVLPKIWLSSQTEQHDEHGLTFHPNKHSRS